MPHLHLLVAISIITALGFTAETAGADADASKAALFREEPCPASTQTRNRPSAADRVCLQQSFGNLPLYFVENQGQLDEEVAFNIQGKDKTLYFTQEGVTFSLHDRDRRWNVKMGFVGPNPDVKPKGKDKQEAVFSYFRGKPKDWHAGISTYSKIVYENLWPGIDLVYSGTVNKLKYDLIVKPGADPSEIRFNISGASDVGLTDSGTLQFKTPVAGFEDDRPTAFQEVGRTRMDVAVSYVLYHMEDGEHFSLGFDLGPYDPEEALVIDPVVIVYCGYIGGSNSDGGRDIALDDKGCVYLTGVTYSSEKDNFPVLAGFDPTYNGEIDAFIAKISPTGEFLIYCSYLGGSRGDSSNSIAIDSDENVYIAGSTYSSERDHFPVLVGPDLTHNGGGLSDVFVAKVSASGSELLYCGYIGGTGNDNHPGIVVDCQGNAYVTGNTDSSETEGFPVLVGPDLTYNGEGDTFVAKIACSGVSLEYCGYIGGSKIEYSGGIAVDSDGNAYVAGSTEGGLPVSNGPDLTYNGNDDGFVAKVDTTGTSLVYCGYIGGTKNDWIEDIEVVGQCAYVVGSTFSYNLPTIIGPDLSYNDSQESDGFIAKVATTGVSLDYCGYIGGSDIDQSFGIAVDSQGYAYVTGETFSSEDNGFPIHVGPDLVFNGDYTDQDAFIAKIIPSGESIEYCGYIGGESTDMGYAIAVDSFGNAYVTGTTRSSEESNFPVLVGPDLTYNIGYGDAFITKIGYALISNERTISVSNGATIDFNLFAGPGIDRRLYLMLGSLHGSEPGIPLPNGGKTLPVTWDSLTDYILSALNGPVFSNFYGELDDYSQATATLNCPPVNPNKIGKVMTFAYCLEGNPEWDFVSNPVEIEFVP